MTVELRTGKLKKLARQMFKGKWPRSIAVVLLVALLRSVPPFILTSLSSSEFISYIADLYTLLITGPLLLGAAHYFLSQFRGEEGAGLDSITGGLGRFWSGVSLFVVTLVFTFLWSLLFVIPGILAAIRYSQAFYILADNPGMPAFECIARSKQMMSLNKGKFFLLELSFLPWLIIASAPSSIAMSRYLDFSGIVYSETMFEDMARAIVIAETQPLVRILSILPLFVCVYMYMANACFYDIVSGNLRLEFGGQVPQTNDPYSRDIYEITGFSQEPAEDQTER